MVRASFLAIASGFAALLSAGCNVRETFLVMGARMTALLEPTACDGKAPGLGTTAMHDAAWAGDVKTIRALAAEQSELVNGRTSNDKVTPLMLAVSNNQTAAAQALVQAGADVNAQDKYGETGQVAHGCGG
jgi:ankyrin repeat protein